MAIDPNRAAFVSQEYRYEEATDEAVKAAYSQSLPATIETNLASADAASLANTLLTWSKNHGLVYEIEIEGVLTPDDLAGTVPHYTLDAPLYSTDARTYKLIGAEVDYFMNTTTLLVRG